MCVGGGEVGWNATGGIITRHFTVRRKFCQWKRREEFAKLLFSESSGSLTVVAGILDNHKTLVPVFVTECFQECSKLLKKCFYDENCEEKIRYLKKGLYENNA